MRYILAALAVTVGVTSFTTTHVRAQDPSPIRTLKDGILDEVKLYAEKLPAATHVVIRSFSATDADIVNGEKKEETKTMQSDGPRMLNERFVMKLKELGPFAEVSALESASAAPDDALVVEGKFTELDPGSRAKRYFVGFGSGKSGVTVEGSVKTASGTLLATFQQRRIGVMGVAGGDSLGKLAADTRSIAEDLAKFLSTWGKGKNLKG
jgi:Domain of unknown function (DUF4410)